MRWWLAGLLALQVVTNPNEPPAYPPGMVCTPQGDRMGLTQTPDHPCSCKNMGNPDDGCETATTNDAHCQQFCHEDHCACPKVCEAP